MFDKESLQLILANAVAAVGSTVKTDAATLAVVPEGVALKNLEQYQALRNRFRGALETQSLPAFVEYVKDREDKPMGNARGFIDQAVMAATVIFNLGTAEEPGHADDTATLTLKPTAAFNGLQAIVGKPLSQQALAEWLEDWLNNLEAYASADRIEMATAINGIRRMSIKSSSQRDSVVGDLSASRSAMDEIEARSQDVLPTAFTFVAVPYEGLSVANIGLRLSVITGRDEPLLKLRWVGEEAQREAFADEFKATLDEELSELISLHIGTFTRGA